MGGRLSPRLVDKALLRHKIQDARRRSEGLRDEPETVNWLGRFGSPEAQAAYDRLIAGFLANGW